MNKLCFPPALFESFCLEDARKVEVLAVVFPRQLKTSVELDDPFVKSFREWLVFLFLRFGRGRPLLVFASRALV